MRPWDLCRLATSQLLHIRRSMSKVHLFEQIGEQRAKVPFAKVAKVFSGLLMIRHLARTHLLLRTSRPEDGIAMRWLPLRT